MLAPLTPVDTKISSLLFLYSIMPSKVEPSTLRDAMYGANPEDSDTTMYSDEDAASVPDYDVTLPAAPLTEEDMQYFAVGWMASLNNKEQDGTMDTSTDENRLCAWRYFKTTNIITLDKTTPTQNNVWESRATRGTLSSTTMERRRRTLAQRFKCVPLTTSSLFFQECLKIATPEQRGAKLLQLQEAELTVGWYGSLRADTVFVTPLPSTPFECSLVEGRQVAWRYYVRTNLIDTDTTTPKQNLFIAARVKRGPLSKRSIQQRIRSLTTHFNGTRGASFWSNVCDANFHLDVVKCASPDKTKDLLLQYQQEDRQICRAREERKQAMIVKRQSNIAFYANVAVVEALLLKKNLYFGQRKRVFKYMAIKKYNPVQDLTLDSTFFKECVQVNSTKGASSEQKVEYVQAVGSHVSF